VGVRLLRRVVQFLAHARNRQACISSGHILNHRLVNFVIAIKVCYLFIFMVTQPAHKYSPTLYGICY